MNFLALQETANTWQVWLVEKKKKKGNTNNKNLEAMTTDRQACLSEIGILNKRHFLTVIFKFVGYFSFLLNL